MKTLEQAKKNIAEVIARMQHDLQLAIRACAEDKSQALVAERDLLFEALDIITDAMEIMARVIEAARQVKCEHDDHVITGRWYNSWSPWRSTKTDLWCKTCGAIGEHDKKTGHKKWWIPQSQKDLTT